MTDELGELATTFLSSQPVVVTIEFDLLRTDPAFTAGFDLVTMDGAVVFRSAYTDSPEASRPRLVEGRNAIRCEIPAGLLNSGRYGINIQMQLHNSQLLVHEVGALGFDVVADHGESLFLNSQGRPGVVAPILAWNAVEPGVGEGGEVSPIPLRSA